MSQVATEAACAESAGVWTHDASSATSRIIMHYLWRSVSELVTTAYVHAGLCPVTTCGNLPALAPLAPGEAWGGQAAVHHAPHMEGLQRLAQVIQGCHLRHKANVLSNVRPRVCNISHGRTAAPSTSYTMSPAAPQTNVLSDIPPRLYDISHGRTTAPCKKLYKVACNPHM